MIAAISSEVATGRRMKGRDGLMAGSRRAHGVLMTLTGRCSTAALAVLPMLAAVLAALLAAFFAAPFALRLLAGRRRRPPLEESRQASPWRRPLAGRRRR